MSEPTPPDKIVFRSDMQTASQKPADYFAEQNKQRAEKKAKQKKQVKLALWIGIPIILILVAGLVVWLVIITSNHSDSSAPGGSEGNPELSEVQDLNNQAIDAFAPTYSSDEDGNIIINGDLDAAEETFATELADAKNADRLDTIYLAQIVFYTSIEDNARAAEIVGKVNPDNLNLSEKIKFYNLAYLAYAALGNTDRANYYYDLTRAITSTENGIGG